MKKCLVMNKHIISESSVARAVIGSNYTNKFVERRHIRQDIIQRLLEFMEIIRQVHPSRLIDLDATFANEKESNK